MRKNYSGKLLFCIALLLGFFTASAQKNISEQIAKANKQEEPNQQKNFKRCYTFELMQAFQKTHPKAVTTQQFESVLKQKIAERKANKVLAQDYVIPVVFHVIHNGENVGTASNLSAALINAQIDQLNIDYGKKNMTTWLDPNDAANTQLQFCLAKVDPSQNILAEPGIDRVNRNAKGFSAPPYGNTNYIDNTIKPNTIWDPNKYFNVWVLDLGGGLLGYATFPAFSTLPGLDNFETDQEAGVVILYGSVGSVNTPGSEVPYNLGRTLTHEAGHFFGLRHIWGDGLDENDNPVQCGTDFCDDTPTQEQENYGCPNPRPITCNNMGDMFENYMDYTDDACMNIFTNDQTTRIQTVMENSPRRIGLGTSQVCGTPDPNSIYFATSGTNVTETGDQGVCPRYKEFNITLKVTSAATGDATVTFVPQNGSTATPGKDYTFTPAAVNYSNGDAADKVITVRIMDDAFIEGEEILNLGFNIAGNGVVPGLSNQVHQIKITDDDFTPLVSQQPVTLIDENFGVLNNPSNIDAWATGSFINPAGKNEWVVSNNGGGDVQGLSLHITQDNVAKPNTYKVNSTSDVLFITPLLNSNSEYKNINLAFRYKSNGEKVGNTYYDFGTIMYSFDGNSFTTLVDNNNVPYRFQGVAQMQNFSVDLPAFLDNTPFYIGFRWKNDNILGNNPGFTVDDIKIVANGVTNVETQVAQNKTTTVDAGQAIYFLSSADGDIIAKINNASADVGCVDAVLSSAGNGLVNIQTTGGNFNRTQKVWQINPEVPNNNVTYQGTLYFTESELNAWGVDKLSLKILKVKSGVDLNGVIQNSDIEVVVPSNVTEFADKGYIAYTGNFTGFSQFMLADPLIVLPVQLINFKAKALSNSIELNWSTMSEINNKGFKVERSTDGNTFTSIGWVDAKGNNNIQQDYRYEDKTAQPNIVYYYRLRQMDLNAGEKLSEIRNAKITRGDLMIVKVLPNPTSGIVKLDITSSSATADIKVFNAQGQRMLYKSKVPLTGSVITLDLSAFSSGAYTLEVVTNTDRTITKVIKQ